jgi:hypothetical protein
MANSLTKNTKIEEEAIKWKMQKSNVHKLASKSRKGSTKLSLREVS